MSTEELIYRLGTIPFEDFMREMEERIKNHN